MGGTARLQLPGRSSPRTRGRISPPGSGQCRQARGRPRLRAPRARLLGPSRRDPFPDRLPHLEAGPDPPRGHPELLEVASKLGSFPRLKASFEDGPCLSSRSGSWFRSPSPRSRARLLENALGLSGAQLARFASHYRKALGPRGTPPIGNGAVHRAPRRWVLDHHRAACLPSQGALIDKALEAALTELMESEDRGLDDDADDPFGARLADCLVAYRRVVSCQVAMGSVRTTSVIS